MALKVIIFEPVMSQKGMGSQNGHVDSSAAQMEDMPLGQAYNVIINLRDSRLPLFISNMLKRQDLIHRHDNIAKNVILGNDITVSVISTDNDKLMRVFIVPKNLVDSFIHQFDVVVSLSIRVEKVYFAVLVLEDQFCGRFVYEHSQNWVVGLVLHDDVLVLQVVKFQLGCVVQHYQKHLCYEKLYYHFLTLHWKHFLLYFVVLD